MLSSLISYVPLLPYPAHFGTRVDPDLFDGIARFYRNKHFFVAYDKWFLEKSLGTLFLIQVLQGEAYNSVAMKKNLA